MGDAGRLEQAFWNVLKNSIKFTPPTGCIAIITSNPQPETLRIRVIDTGNGIEAEKLPRFFPGTIQTGANLSIVTAGSGSVCRLRKEFSTCTRARSRPAAPGKTKGRQLPSSCR